MSRFPHHISDLGLFTIFGYIDERHGDLPRHSAEQKSNNSKLPSENLAGVGRSKTARGQNSQQRDRGSPGAGCRQIGQKDPGASCRQEKPGQPGRKLQAGETGAARGASCRQRGPGKAKRKLQTSAK